MKSLESFIPPQMAEAVGNTLLHAIWQLSAVALLLIVVLALLPQAAAKLRYWLSVGAMALMLAMPLVTFGLVYEAPVESTAFSPMVYAPSVQPTAPSFANYQPPAAPPAVEADLWTSVTGYVEGNSYWFLGIWVAGMVLFTFRFLGGCLQVHRLRHRNLKTVPETLEDRFQDLIQRMGIRQQIGLKFSTVIDTPMVIGAFKPVVLLPASLLSGLSIEQVECILIHELAHVRRWDYLVNMVQSMVEIVLFFHPATWWVTKVIRQERENCCDETVVHMHSNKVQYARALLNLEMMRQQAPSLALASQGGDLANRIRRITGGVVPPKRRFHARGLVYGVVTVAVALLLASQTPAVVKAALPFFVEDVGDADDPDQGQTPATATSVATTPSSGNLTSMQAALKLAGLLGNVRIEQVGQDSPVTKVVIQDDNEEIVMTLGANGKVTAATKNGTEVSKEELASYQEKADALFQPKDDMQIPPMPPIPPLGTLSPMPPLPAFPPMGAFPPMPDLPSVDPNDTRKYEQAMEEYGKAMEAWGERFAQQFDGRQWEEYGKQAANWAQAFVGIGMGPETEEMKKLRAEMERVEEDLKHAKSEERRADLSHDMDELTERLSRLQEENMERTMGDFEARMEAWGEQFGRQMERLGDLKYLNSDAFGRDMEELAERAADEAERDAEDAMGAEDDAVRAADEAAEEADADAREADDAAREADDAARRADEEAEEAERAYNAAEILAERLVDDGIIKSARSYKLRINNKEMSVNGKTVTGTQHKKYLRILEKEMGIKVGKDWVTISHNSR